eukprot:TRINITY_DN2169_c0_g2_i1.p1 TRINITY_DN2169_c0_g2~~TRINITY_DN2169_c0_g2_i1.p1  ORF type:complete len:196 (-),score=21.65 TRINITY_DN2169_c0_g2_i1:12-572(-)
MEDHGLADDPFKQTPHKLSLLLAAFQRRFQKFADDVTPYVYARWTVVFLLFIIYVVRIYFINGWYIITYALGIYILNQLIGFLSPLVDPETEDSGALPTKADDDYKPFVRKLPEFKFWFSCTRAFLIALTCTFFSVLNIPAFWPILLVYFIALFFVTMKRQIAHMLKHHYIPFTVGKPKYFSGDKK